MVNYTNVNQYCDLPNVNPSHEVIKKPNRTDNYRMELVDYLVINHFSCHAVNKKSTTF